jgi:hypothetical protein
MAGRSNSVHAPDTLPHGHCLFQFTSCLHLLLLLLQLQSLDQLHLQLGLHSRHTQERIKPSSVNAAQDALKSQLEHVFAEPEHLSAATR